MVATTPDNEQTTVKHKNNNRPELYMNKQAQDNSSFTPPSSDILVSDVNDKTSYSSSTSLSSSNSFSSISSRATTVNDIPQTRYVEFNPFVKISSLLKLKFQWSI